MPVLKDFRETKVITLPSYPDSKVEIYPSLLMADVMDFNLEDSGKFEFSVRLLPKLIKSWNFTDEAGQVLPITMENLGFLQAVDVEFLASEFAKFSEERKKK